LFVRRKSVEGRKRIRERDKGKEEMQERKGGDEGTKQTFPRPTATDVSTNTNFTIFFFVTLIVLTNGQVYRSKL
jgi:hypothetical protein